jgi:hypothetical protein
MWMMWMVVVLSLTERENVLFYVLNVLFQVGVGLGNGNVPAPL